jgi:hypothetical protein
MSVEQPFIAQANFTASKPCAGRKKMCNSKILICSENVLHTKWLKALKLALIRN